MVVCRYFLQGRCYFGQDCKNEHIYNNTNDGRGGRNSGNSQANNIAWQIASDVVAAEKGGQWPLTSFAPIKEGPSLPGWIDLSPEEVRWTLYEARKNGTVDQALNVINGLYKNAEKERNLLKQPTAEVINMLNDIWKGKKLAQSQQPSPNVGGFRQSDTSAKSTFRFDTAVNNIFGQSPASAPPNTSNIFGGGSQQFPSQNIFGGPVSSPPPGNASSNIFSRPQPPAGNIFSSATNVGHNIFSNNTNSGGSGSVFSGSNAPGQSLFPSHGSVFPAGNLTSSNVFIRNSNADSAFHGAAFPQPFGAAPGKNDASFPSNPNPSVDSRVYSKLEDLNENEINSFTSTTFTFGKIPLKPPAQQHC